MNLRLEYGWFADEAVDGDETAYDAPGFAFFGDSGEVSRVANERNTKAVSP